MFKIIFINIIALSFTFGSLQAATIKGGGIYTNQNGLGSNAHVNAKITDENNPSCGDARGNLGAKAGIKGTKQIFDLQSPIHVESDVLCACVDGNSAWVVGSVKVEGPNSPFPFPIDWEILQLNKENDGIYVIHLVGAAAIGDTEADLRQLFCTQPPTSGEVFGAIPAKLEGGSFKFP